MLTDTIKKIVETEELPSMGDRDSLLVQPLADSASAYVADDMAELTSDIEPKYATEINNCAAEARKLGGNRVTRAKRMKRCICPTARGWRFAPGKPMTVEEKASKGTLILSLKTGVRGRVKKCGVVVKK